MPMQSLPELAACVAVAALIGALLGALISRLLSKPATDPQVQRSLQDLSNLVDQSARATREAVEAVRGALTNAERALTAKVDEGMQAGFDRFASAVTEGAKAQTAQIDAFRSEVTILSTAMTKLATEIPAAFETADAKAKADAAEASKTLLAGVAAALQAGFDRSLAAMGEGAKVQAAQIDAFRTEIAAVTAGITKLGTEVPAALATSAAQAKVDAAEVNKVLATELTTGLRQHTLDQGTKIDAFSTKMETSGAAVAKALLEFQTALGDSMGAIRTTITQFNGDMTTTLADNHGKTAKALADELIKLAERMDTKITEMRAGNEAKLLEIQGVVDQKLQEGIEKRMTESFAKITTQFSEVQQAVGEVRTVVGQVGDLKRLFANVKSRGGWGEAQVKATLDDILPPNFYEMNKCVNPATAETVEFALKLPIQGGDAVYLAVDSKFPVEDYTRLLEAVEAADLQAEKSARSALELRIRQEAKKIQTTYIVPPHTVEWAILYLPSEGLYSEVMRNGDLTESVHRDHRVVIMGPSMLGVMLRTIQLGHYTLAIGQKADLIGQILGAVKHEMVDFSNQFRLLEKNVQALGNNIKRGATRANVISRKLKGVAAIEGPAATELLELPPEHELLSEIEDEVETAAE